MINTKSDEGERVDLANCAVYTMLKRSSGLITHCEKLEERIADDTTNLNYSRQELTLCQLGLLEVKRHLLDSLREFIDSSVDDIHKTVLRALDELQEMGQTPATGSTLREMTVKWLEATDGDYNDASILGAITDLTTRSLLIRGGPDHPPELQGRYWSAVEDLEADIEKTTKDLDKQGAFEGLTLGMSAKEDLPSNVAVLRRPEP